MSMPDNTTNLSVLGVVKWLMVIGSLPLLWTAWQGIVQQQVAGNGPPAAQVLTGREAVWFGAQSLLWAALLLAGAWALWFFWQRYED